VQKPLTRIDLLLNLLLAIGEQKELETDTRLAQCQLENQDNLELGKTQRMVLEVVMFGVAACHFH
jgi:hypothetical protein